MEVIKNIAQEYSIDDFNQYFNFVKPDDLVFEMNNSSILLTLSSISSKKRYFGIMTTKFFEAIGVNRPILCIPDNKDNLSKLIKESKCGLVSSDIGEIEEFLLENFAVWKSNGHTIGSLNDTVRLSFSREKGAEILENLFLKAIEKNN
jgi:hypothetical protein